MEIKDHERGAGQQSRYEVLQQVSGVIAAHADLNGVLESLARFLPSVVSFEFLGVALHNPERRVFQRVTMEDEASAGDLFATLMGDKVEPRRQFIEQNAHNVRFLDV